LSRVIGVVALVVALATGGGIATERRLGDRAVGLARRVMNVMLYGIAPFVFFFNVAHVEIDADVGIGIALAWAALALATGAAFLAGRALALPRPGQGAMMCAVLQGNTGFFGLPATAALLGRDDLPVAATYDALVQAPALILAGVGIGAAYGSRAGATPRERARSFVLRNPPLVAVALALVLPKSFAPQVLVDVAQTVVFLMLPLGFFVVGVQLATEAAEGATALPPPLTREVAVTTLLRVVVAPLLLLALAAPLIDLPAPYLLLAATPVGINTLLVGHAFGLDLRLLAGAVAWSTAVVVAVLVGIGILA
jgi:malate permease and related proteins